MTRAASDKHAPVRTHAPNHGDPAITFGCAECGKPSPLKGRLFRRVRKGMARGLRAYVCAGCGA